MSWGLLPQSQDILYQPLGVSHVWSRAKAQTFTSETVTTLAAHPPDLHNENRFFKPMGSPRMERCSAVSTNFACLDLQQGQIASAAVLIM